MFINSSDVLKVEFERGAGRRIEKSIDNIYISPNLTLGTKACVAAKACAKPSTVVRGGVEWPSKLGAISWFRETVIEIEFREALAGVCRRRASFGEGL